MFVNENRTELLFNYNYNEFSVFGIEILDDIIIIGKEKRVINFEAKNFPKFQVQERKNLILLGSDNLDVCILRLNDFKY